MLHEKRSLEVEMKKVDLTLPESFLLRADEVIE